MPSFVFVMAIHVHISPQSRLSVLRSLLLRRLTVPLKSGIREAASLLRHNLQFLVAVWFVIRRGILCGLAIRRPD